MEKNKDWKEELEKIGCVRKIIIKKHKKEIGVGRDFADNIVCPYCKGVIHYAMANSVNGHISATCENGCVSWIE